MQLRTGRRRVGALAFCGALAHGSASLRPARRDGEAARPRRCPAVGLMHAGHGSRPADLCGEPVRRSSRRSSGGTCRISRSRAVWRRSSLELRPRRREHRADVAEPQADEADEQAEVFVGQGVDVIVAFEDQSIERRAEGDHFAGLPNDPGRLPPPLRSASATAWSRASLTQETNLTGVFGARDVVAKQLEYYQLLVPRLHRVLTLVDPEDPRTERLLTGATRQPPRSCSDRSSWTSARRRAREDLKRVFRSLRPGEVDGALLLSTSLRLEPHGAHHPARQARAAAGPGAPQGLGRAGGALLVRDRPRRRSGRAGARYVDSILGGASPAELPVEEIPDVEFALNLATARPARDQGAAGDDHPGRQRPSVAGAARAHRWNRPHGRTAA